MLVNCFNKIKNRGDTVNISSLQIGFILIFATFTFFLFVSQLIKLQVLAFDDYIQLANSNFLQQREIVPTRGLITDKDGKLLVENKPFFKIGINLALVSRYKTYTDISQVLEPFEIKYLRDNSVAFSNNDLDDLNAAVSSGKDVFILKSFYSNFDYVTLKASLNNMYSDLDYAPKLQINTDVFRFYTNVTLSHVLGYLGSVSEKDLENSWYTANDSIGKDGLELSYEDYLRGVKGLESLEYTSRFKIKSHKTLKPAVNGNKVITSIDSKLQNVAYEALKHTIEESAGVAGSVVVQRPTGEILALANYPSYDNNDFAKSISTQKYSEYINNPIQPLNNRAIALSFPPGSTFKIVMSLAGLQDNLISKDTTINDVGIIHLNGYDFRTWKAGGHGVINVEDALKESSDIFFYVLGGGHADYPQVKSLGPEGIYNWASKFGLGLKTQIDLPFEDAGFLPTPEWKEEVLNEPWYVGNTYHYSIGQGYLTTTPLQVNQVISAIANKGEIYKPHLVTKIEDANGQSVKEIKPEVIYKLPVSQENIETVKAGLSKATKQGGTAYTFFEYPIDIAGKTGTSEFGVDPQSLEAKTHAWFAAFAPLNNPEIVVTAFVEEGGGGSDVSAPIVKKVFDSYFNVKSE